MTKVYEMASGIRFYIDSRQGGVGNTNIIDTSDDGLIDCNFWKLN